MGIEIHQRARAGRMSGESFRAFQDGRPDHERWELIAGVPMMMTPPAIAHNHIATNLQRLLNDGLAVHDPSRLATQRPGIELGSGDYRPEPDVGVIDAEYEAGQRFVERVYLLAEIVSASDEVRVSGMDQNWIDVKRDLYLAHAAGEAVLIIEQDWIEVSVDVRSGEVWQSAKLGPGDELSLPRSACAAPSPICTTALRCSHARFRGLRDNQQSGAASLGLARFGVAARCAS